MDDIIIEQTYPYPIESVWEALTDPAALADWLMPGDFKPIVGHTLHFHCDPRPEFDGTVNVEILEVEKPRRLSYSWKTGDIKKPTVVTFILTPTCDGHTRLRLEHKGFDGDNGLQMHPLLKNGWGHKLSALLEPVIARMARNDATQINKTIVREFTRLFKNEHNVDGIHHLFASDFQHHFKPPVRLGLEGFKNIGRMMNTAFPDVVVTEEDLIVSGDKVVERSSAVATHRASLTGEQPTNKQVRWTEIHIYRLRDGKIAEHWVEFAMLELLKQIGAVN